MYGATVSQFTLDFLQTRAHRLRIVSGTIE